jgi:hypothetical protein
MAASLFRFIAGAARNIIVAYVFGSFAILVVMLLGGFVVSRGTNQSSFSMMLNSYCIRPRC